MRGLRIRDWDSYKFDFMCYPKLKNYLKKLLPHNFKLKTF